MIAVVDNCSGLSGLQYGIACRGVPQAHCVELDDLQVLTQFIVKLARDSSPFLFLERDALLRKTPYVSQCEPDLRLSNSTARNFPPGVPVSACREPR
jgi:hypothetical protein